DIEAAKNTVRARKGIDTNVVKDVHLKEGRSIQVLHVGLYDEVGPVYERLMGHMTAQGLSCSGPPHEVYINDPRRVAPERIKTIVRIPIR
ncbi:MAG: GyrI-like domain-containing protein, partial [Acidobacteriota bacterium]